MTQTIQISHDARSLVVSHDPAVANLFPSAPVLEHGNTKFHVLPHGIPEVALLRRLGYRAVSPMLEYYDWCGGKPFEVQRATCDLLTLNTHAYVLNDMGTGKTKAALWAWDYLNKEKFAGKVLILAPLSTINFVWAREAFATIPHRKVSVLYGTKAQRLKKLDDPDADIFVLNHDGLGVLFEELRMRTDIDTIVVDELAVFRNGASKRSKMLRILARDKKWVWGMTGSPMPNTPTDVWAQAMIVTPHTVPKYYSHLRDILMKRRNTFLWVPKPDAVENAFKCLQPAVRYKLDEVVELPDVIEREIEIELTPEQKKAYHEMAQDCVVQLKNGQITAANAGAAMSKLLQIAGGWAYKGDSVVAFDSNTRIQAVIEAVLGTDRKALLLVPFRHALEGVSSALKKEGISHEVIHGDTRDRDAIFTAFQSTDKYKVLVAHPVCLHHGLTLTAADTVIWYLPVPSLEVYEQVNARIRRYGQTHKQQILHVVGTPVERRLYSLLRSKEKVQDKFLAMFEDASLWRVTL